MSHTRRNPFRLLTILAAAIALSTLGGCHRISDGLGLTGQVTAVAPQPIGPQRLRVSLPSRATTATLAPVARRDNVTVWQTLDGITLSLRGGLLIATRGLGNDLMSSDVTDNLAMLAGHTGNEYYPQIRSYLDGEDRTVFRASQCRRSGQQQVQTLVDGERRMLTQIEETCLSPNQRVTNSYWVDQSGVVLKSRQWVGPKNEYMETEHVLR